jgi:hypothetical protein
VNELDQRDSKSPNWTQPDLESDTTKL